MKDDNKKLSEKFVDYFGSRYALSKKLGKSTAAVYGWSRSRTDEIPKPTRYDIYEITKGYFTLEELSKIKISQLNWPKRAKKSQ